MGLPSGLRQRLIPEVTKDVDLRPHETSRVPPSPVPAFRPPYAEECFEAASPESSPLPWPSPGVTGSALPCPLRVTIPTLQGSLDGTDYWVAPPSQRDTPLHHPQSPRCSGSLLRGALALTTTGLAPLSRR